MSGERDKKYLLLDASVVAGYYLRQAARSKKCCDLSRQIIEAVRDGLWDHFLYIPNFCIAEVFSAFMKHAYGYWNRHVKKTIDERIHKSLRAQFQHDIHNANLFYHYELSRYHILAINLVAPIDHWYQMARPQRTKKGVSPAGTFDQLIVAMGVHLTKIHGSGSVIIITTDDRLADLINKCKSNIGESVMRTTGLNRVKTVTGISFETNSFPEVINLRKITKSELAQKLGNPPLLKRKKRNYLK